MLVPGLNACNCYGMNFQGRKIVNILATSHCLGYISRSNLNDKDATPSAKMNYTVCIWVHWHEAMP